MDDKTHTSYIVRIELQRIQTYLFAVPRLRAMLGANALLGHALRSTLPVLAAQHDAVPCQWPATIEIEGYDDDPLSAAAVSDDWTAWDDPLKSLNRGILSRDGGHLRIAFPNKDCADAFIVTAREHLAAEFPDLLVGLDRFPAGAEPKMRDACVASRVVHLPELPQFQVCTRSGYGVATEAASKTTARDGYISTATKSKEEAGTAFQKGDATKRDFISLLRPHLPGSDSRIPRDLEELSDEGGYIALVHADGNRVGQRIKAHERIVADTLSDPDWLTKECAIEAFFHSMRGAVRASLCSALKAVFNEEVLAEQRYLPYQILMLGGDDLLLLCHPRYALSFLEHYAAELAKRPLVDGEPLSIGAGVVIAKHSLPFHRLHQLAETLASSAKRAYLQCPAGWQDPGPPERSAVDWAVLTSSWGEDPIAHRHQHDLIRYCSGNAAVALALSAKPYFILDDHADMGDVWAPSLASLLKTAETLAEIDELPRSQLKEMLRRLEHGKESAALAYQELLAQLPDSAKTALAELIGSNRTPWRPVRQTGQDTAELTQLKDLIECLELRYLGRRKQELDHD